MASLKDYAQNHPIATATVGATGGLGGGWLSRIHELTTFVQFISALFGSLVAITAFLLALPKLIRLIRNARARGLINADKDSEPPFPPTR